MSEPCKWCIQAQSEGRRPTAKCFEHRPAKPSSEPRTLAEVAAWVAYIGEISDDYEGAHAAEDELHLSLLKLFASGAGTREEMIAMAAEAIKTDDFYFSRWCA